MQQIHQTVQTEQIGRADEKIAKQTAQIKGKRCDKSRKGQPDQILGACILPHGAVHAKAVINQQEQRRHGRGQTDGIGRDLSAEG